MALLERTDGEATVGRPAAQLFSEERVAGDDEGSVAEDARGRSGQPPEAARPGYGPDRLRLDPVEPAGSMREWFRRQTYVSLTVKVGFVATLWGLLVFGSLAVALTVAAG